MWIWITIAVLVVLVVIGFLFGIASALESIDAGLEEADTALVGANGDVTPLPTHIQNVNAGLERVDTALKPISGQATTIKGELGSIRSKLGDTEGSLVSTERSLVDTEGELNSTEASLNDTERSLNSTEGSLVDTEGNLNDTEGSLNDTAGSLGDTSMTLEQAEARLMSIRSKADRIQRRLELAQDFRSLGTNGIWRRVRFLNGGRFFDASSDVADQTAPPRNRTSRINREGLRFIERDADPIRSQLLDVNRDLTSICEQLRPLDIPNRLTLQPGDIVQPGNTEGASEEC